jgi:transcriptional regulator with XRE-family HTH domain
MKRNPKLEARRKKISDDTKIFIDEAFAIVEQIDIILRKKGMNQKQFADLMGKSEAEISKWMSGMHNFTQLTLAKIRAKLGEPITICPKDVKYYYTVIIANNQDTAILDTQQIYHNAKKSLTKLLDSNEEKISFSLNANESSYELASAECLAKLN